MPGSLGGFPGIVRPHGAVSSAVTRRLHVADWPWGTDWETTR